MYFPQLFSGLSDALSSQLENEDDADETEITEIKFVIKVLSLCPVMKWLVSLFNFISYFAGITKYPNLLPFQSVHPPRSFFSREFKKNMPTTSTSSSPQKNQLVKSASGSRNFTISSSSSSSPSPRKSTGGTRYSAKAFHSPLDHVLHQKENILHLILSLLMMKSKPHNFFHLLIKLEENH